MLSDRVNTPLDLLADPHARAVHVAPVLDRPGLGRLPLPAIPGIGAWNRPAPALGEQTDAILREIADTTLP
jgi:crotonobetainyl-CoA:carnitine CoA-transferase CaiB-like acyl-CoA transferase